MEKKKMQIAAYNCIREIETSTSEYLDSSLEIKAESIKSALIVATGKIEQIESSHCLLYNFFFPLCEQLDTVFYSQSYKRSRFGHCHLQQKIISCINGYWKNFNSIAFEEQVITKKKASLVENIDACRRLYERRKKMKVPPSAEIFLEKLVSDFFADVTYEQVCNQIKPKINNSLFEESIFYSFLFNFFIHHPPLVGRTRKEVLMDDNHKMYVDIWSSDRPAKARLLYLHGWHDSPDSAKLLAQIAINEDIEVHAIHLPGHGLNFSNQYISIADLQNAFLTYYSHLLESPALPLIVAGHSMGGAILASCLNSISNEQLKQVVFFAPAFSAKQLDLLQEKMPLIHKNLNQILSAENKKNLLRGGRGPVHPLLGMIATLFSKGTDNLYTLMQQGYHQFTNLKELSAKIILIYGYRDHCINYTVLQAIEKHAGVVIRNAEFDHAPHLFPGCGGAMVTKSVLNAVHTAHR